MWIDHNVELQTRLQQFSNFTNEHKQCVNLLVASIWKCKYIEWARLIFAICFIIVGWSLDFIRFTKSITR